VEESAPVEGAQREVVHRGPTQRQLQLPGPSWLDTPTAEQGRHHLGRRTRADGKPGEERVTLTYKQLHREVCRFANVLKRNGIKKGDRVLIYLPMVPEAAIAMLACARIGAVHSVVFGGFSAQSVADRIQDCGARLVITADGGYRRGTIVPLKKNVDDALKLKDAKGEPSPKTIEKVIVLRRTVNDIHMQEGRDLWWHRELEYVRTPLPGPRRWTARLPLFILYTSGSTGKPKGILHTTAGYLLGAKMTAKYVFDLKDEDVYWCTADVGWVTGHSYVVYGPLANGATSVMYEGAPNWPGAGPLLAHRREIRRHHSLHRADGHPRVHEVGRPNGRQSTISVRCACWARWANPSIPKRGCGITKSSAANAARSSIPGGRPRPAAS
jgi:acyl-coenzyme A synthetase/AMP-(fatty) acid ligase